MIFFDHMISLGGGCAGDAVPLPKVDTAKVDWIVTISRSGEFQGIQRGVAKVDCYRWPARGSKLRTAPGPIETATFTLGVATTPERGREARAAYAQTLETLARAGEPWLADPIRSVRAFVSSDKEVSKAVSAVTGGPIERGQWVWLQVEGGPDWRLDPAVAALHGRNLQEYAGGGENGVQGTCPFCERVGVTLAKTYPPVHGDLRLVSFNAASFEAYGKEQGYNAPSCVPCAKAMSDGLGRLYRDRAARKSMGRDSAISRLLWGAEGQGLWSAWDSLWRSTVDGVSIPGATTAQFGPELSFCLVEQNGKARLALRRYAVVQSADVLGRVHQWKAAFGDGWIGHVAATVVGRPRRSTLDVQFDRVLEQLYLHLIAGEELPAALAHRVRARLLLSNQQLAGIAHDQQWTQAQGSRKRLAQISTYLGKNVTPIEESTLVGEELGSYLLGRAYARAAVCQRRRSPQIRRGLSETVYDAAKANPERIAVTVRRAIEQGRQVEGRWLPDPTGLRYHTEATRAPAALALRATTRLTLCFLRGYDDQRGADRAAWEAWKTKNNKGETNE